MRAAQAVMADLAASGLTPEQLALVMELSATVAAEARPAVDKAAENKRAYDREYRRKSRKSRTTSYESNDTVPPNEILTPSAVLPDEASASSPVRQPLAEARSVWNEAAAKAGWPQIRSSSANRDRQLAARLRQHGLDGWKSTIVRARASPYLAGADPPSWFTFSWLIKSENFLKVSEGNYDRNRSRNQRPATSNWEAAYLANVGDGSGFG